MFFLFFFAIISLHSIRMCLQIGVNMKRLSRIFRIYSEASIAVLMAAGCIVELLCAVGLYLYNAPVLALCALVAACFFSLASSSFAVSVYRDAKRSNLI